MDPYKVLGVDKDAQITEIRQAHRKLVLKCHPDKVQDPELKALKQDEFQKVQQAYEILSDEKERQKYDDKIRLAELRQQFQNKANSSATRSSPKVYEVRTVDPASRSYTTTKAPAPPNVKIYASYSRSYEEDRSRAKGYYDAGIPRRETFSDKPSKREVERDRERAEKEREREKRRAKKEREAAKEAAAEEQRRAEKAAKKERNKAKDKQRSKEQRREKEEKRRERSDVYIESYSEDEPPPLPRQSSKTYDERRERSSHRDDDEFLYQKNYAMAYISRSKNSGADRYGKPPAAPTPPPAGASIYPPPEEEEVRRSSARSRRGSADIPPAMPKERSYHRSSREPVLDEEAYEAHIVNASPAARSARRFAPGGPPDVVDSPPRGISRTHTMPADIPSARPVPVPPRRSATYTDSYGSPEYSANRGRHRSKNMPQVAEMFDSEDSEVEYERQRRSKHRSSRKTRSPESPAGGAEIRYQVDGGRTKLHSYSGSYSRRLESEQGYYHEPPSRPMYREPSYISPASSGFKVKQSKTYNVEDVAYSNYGMPHYHQEGMSAARA